MIGYGEFENTLFILFFMIFLETCIILFALLLHDIASILVGKNRKTSIFRFLREFWRWHCIQF